MTAYLKILFVISIQLAYAAAASATSFAFTPSVNTTLPSSVTGKCVSGYTGANSFPGGADRVDSMLRNCTLVKKQAGTQIAGVQGSVIQTNAADDFSFSTSLLGPKVNNLEYCTWNKDAFRIDNPFLPGSLIRAAGNASACGETTVHGGVVIETCVDGPDPDDPEMGEEGEEECVEPDRSPILLDLDRNQFHLSGGPVLFDIDADGQLETITWVAPGTQDAFLFLDRNGNGVVDDGSELFGNATLLISGEQADHGYEALAEFDLVENAGNQDGVIDDADSIFSNLGVWIDSNANGIHESFESQSLAEAGVLSIGLDYRESRRTDSHGNEFRYIGSGSIEVNGKSKKMATTDVFFKILAE